MANQTSGNPLVLDTPGTITGTHFIRQIQWIDDNQDIADGSSLVFSINGVTITCTTQVNGADFGSVVRYDVGSFEPPVKVQDIVLTTLSHGALHIWLL